MEHLTFLKQSFKIFKPEVLIAAGFKRWNETVFQNFCETSWLSKMLFKNVCINPILNLKRNVKEADSNVFESLGITLKDNVLTII